MWSVTIILAVFYQEATPRGTGGRVVWTVSACWQVRVPMTAAHDCLGYPECHRGERGRTGWERMPGTCPRSRLPLWPLLLTFPFHLPLLIHSSPHFFFLLPALLDTGLEGGSLVPAARPLLLAQVWDLHTLLRQRPLVACTAQLDHHPKGIPDTCVHHHCRWGSGGVRSSRLPPHRPGLSAQSYQRVPRVSLAPPHPVRQCSGHRPIMQLSLTLQREDSCF